MTERFTPACGTRSVRGAVLFVLGSLYLMDTNVPEFQISLAVILPTAGTLLLAVLVLGWLVAKTRSAKVLSGMDSLVGTLGEVREAVSQKHGMVLVNGELWNARSEDGRAISKGSIVVVKSSAGMMLTVSPKEA